MGCGTLGEVQGLSGGPRRVEGTVQGDPRGGLGWVWGPSGRSGTVWWTVPGFCDGSRNLPEVWNGSGGPRGTQGWVGGPSDGRARVKGLSERSGTGPPNLREVRDGSGDRYWGTGWFRGPTGRSGTGQGILGEVRDGLGDPRGDFERVGGLSETFGTGCGNPRGG